MYKIKIDLYDSNLITGSSDRLRQTIGGYYKIANIEDTPEMNRTLEFQDPAASDGDAYGESVADLPGTAMIEKILVAPYLAITASATSIFPYYVIPVSIMGIGPEKGPDELMDPADDAALLNSDEKWRSYILGGTFNTVEYPGVYAPGTFNVNNFSFELPYDLLYAKAIDEENHATYETVEKKSVYNMYLPEYQNFNENNNEKDLLNIYDLMYCAHVDADLATAETKERISLGGAYTDTTLATVFSSTPAFTPALIKTSDELPEAVNSPIQYTDAYTRIRGYYYDLPLAPNGSGIDTSTMKNLLFNKKAISDLFPEVYNHALEAQAYYPFYNKIGLPVFSAGALNSLVVDSGFSNLLLKSIKDTFVSGIYETSDNSFVAVTQPKQLDKDGSLYDSSNAINLSHKYVDFKEILASLNNNPTAIASSPCRFVGESNFDSRAAIDYGGGLRHINKKSAFLMLDKIQNGILSLDPGADLPEDVGTATYMPWSDLDGFSINQFMSLADGDLTQKAECVALRIKKTNISTTEEANFIIQNQPPEAPPTGIFDSAVIDVQKWCYHDTQVKYGETYEYETYAYFMVVGYEYEYSDLVLSRKISEYGQYEQGSGATFEKLTCIEFYNPTTGLAEASPMLTSKDTSIDEVRLSLLGKVSTAGYATAAQELATGRSINWADFNIKIEPTIKIFEVLLDNKALTVLDNPPPKLDVVPYQVKDQSQAVGFFIKLENPPVKITKKRSSLYPTPTNATETVNYSKYLSSQNMLDTDKLAYGTISRPTIVEVYRLSSKPESMSDFNGNLITTKSLIIDKDSEKNDKDNRTYISPVCFYEERIASGHKFYYAFRFLNENNVPSPWSSVTEAELIDDGGYKYTNFSNILESELGQGIQYDDPFTQFKKLLMIRPAIPQIDMNSANIDYNDIALNQFENVKIASTLSDSLWEKTYKVRLTSKKTGKKIDLNVSYKLATDTSGGA